MPHEEPDNNEDTNPPDPHYTPFPLPLGKNMWGRARHKVQSWLKGDIEERHGVSFMEKDFDLCDAKEREELKKNPNRKTLPGLSRPLTFARLESERRDRLLPHQPDPDERRALSVDRRAATIYPRTLSPPHHSIQPSHSAPDISNVVENVIERPPFVRADIQEPISPLELSTATTADLDPQWPKIGKPTASIRSFNDEQDNHERLLIQTELEAKWILNLSMHFKDRSEREKFFITYAQEPNRWRRLTVSIDYRNPEPDSLEEDLKCLRYQRDKNARIYESIRDSLPDIQFYSTVTNLKLKTMDGRLHVHCSEDLNEIIHYPRASMLQYLGCPLYKESEVEFQSHMSGFVYKVNVDGRTLVKKEIPGPEAVDEFLYEIAALAELKDAAHVINFEALVVNEEGDEIRGLLISLASQGALVDLIYDSRYANNLPWSRRERWARQIIQGLSEVHESGFVQGDFTLSNIVADDDDNLNLIDINRRGCPVGWEPPELEDKIRAGQRISMFIGVKTDLFQLGMVLWALAMCVDEPELEPRPLRAVTNADVPLYFRNMVELCLSTDPRKRPSAKELLAMFPEVTVEEPIKTLEDSGHFGNAKAIDPCSMVDYIGPGIPATIDNVRSIPRGIDLKAPSQLSDVSSIRTYPDGTAASSEYMFDDKDLGFGRRPPRDASPVTQSDGERPRTRGESDFGSKADVSFKDHPTVIAESSYPTITENPTLSRHVSEDNSSKQEDFATPSDICSSVSTLTPNLVEVGLKSTEEAVPQRLQEIPEKSPDGQVFKESSKPAIHDTAATKENDNLITSVSSKILDLLSSESVKLPSLPNVLISKPEPPLIRIEAPTETVTTNPNPKSNPEPVSEPQPEKASHDSSPAREKSIDIENPIVAKFVSEHHHVLP